MITGNEILAELKKVQIKIKCNMDLFPNNDIWQKLFKEISAMQEILRKDLKMFGYE